MGDRTTVIVTVRNCDADRASNLLEADTDEESRNLTQFIFEECNWGEVDGLEKLVKQGIPFNRWHDDGDNYSAEYLTVRFRKDGTVQVKQWVDATEDLIDVKTIQKILDQEYTCYEDQLREIEFIVQNKLDESDPLDWESQEENAKVAKTHALVNPDYYKTILRPFL